VSLGSGAVTAYSYDRTGKLVSVVFGAKGVLETPVQPYGFTYLTSRKAVQRWGPLLESAPAPRPVSNAR